MRKIKSKLNDNVINWEIFIVAVDREIEVFIFGSLSWTLSP